jgi:hypothetical protein
MKITAEGDFFPALFTGGDGFGRFRGEGGDA